MVFPPKSYFPDTSILASTACRVNILLSPFRILEEQRFQRLIQTSSFLCIIVLQQSRSSVNILHPDLRLIHCTQAHGGTLKLDILQILIHRHLSNPEPDALPEPMTNIHWSCTLIPILKQSFIVFHTLPQCLEFKVLYIIP